MVKRSFCILGLTASLSSWAALPPLNIDLDKTTVSGLSSGGYMATQFHFAHSEWITGIGVIAAGPYYCAQGDIKQALSRCVNSIGEGIPLDKLNEQIALYRSQGKLAPQESFSDDKVWLLHGTEDKKVVAGVNDKLFSQYQTVVSPDAVRYVNDKPFAHHFPTLDKGGDCKTSASPFLGSCQFDAAGEMLNYLHDGLRPKTNKPSGQLVTFDQQELGGDVAESLADEGYLYIPKACQQGQQCTIHISFHGCNQNAQAVGTTFATQSGLNNWADQNNMLVMYPQTKKSLFMPLNPQACWDWWGYTDANYSHKDGQQIQAVYNMVQAIAGNKEGGH